jgi:NAD(P)-dependent dehydrogenase (short-subunit alcohol dehydrogenase family)
MIYQIAFYLFILAPWIISIVTVVLLIRYWIAGSQTKADISAKGKWICVTGAASGVGRAACHAVLNYGGNVYAVDFNEEALRAAFVEYKEDRVVCVKVDVTDAKSVEALKEKCRQTGLFGVVNCAGIMTLPGRKSMLAAGVVEVDVDKEVLPVINVNLLGTMKVNAALFDYVWQTKGVFVNIASTAGRMAIPLPAGIGPYCVSKHGVVGYTCMMRRELAPYNIRTYCVEPGGVDTPLIRHFVAEAPDTSRTRLLERTFGLLSRNGGKMDVGLTCQSPDVVADRILSCLFYSGWMPPHIIVDSPLLYVAYHIAGWLPHHWLDWIIALVQRRTAAS